MTGYSKNTYNLYWCGIDYVKQGLIHYHLSTPYWTFDIQHWILVLVNMGSVGIDRNLNFNFAFAHQNIHTHGLVNKQGKCDYRIGSSISFAFFPLAVYSITVSILFELEWTQYGKLDCSVDFVDFSSFFLQRMRWDEWEKGRRKRMCIVSNKTFRMLAIKFQIQWNKPKSHTWANFDHACASVYT